LHDVSPCDDRAVAAPDVVFVNGRGYAKPRTRTAVVCTDGLDPRYLDDAFGRGLMPRVRELAGGGTFAIGRSQLPSFTNPNNLSIVTGAPASVHGIPGNHYLDASGDEVQLVEPRFLRAISVHAVLGAAGTRVLAVTTKDKLRALLGAGGVPSVSAERADVQTLQGVGIVADTVDRPKPDIYDWDCSHYALELGLELGDRLEIELLYVSLTDFVQHAAAPGDELSDRYLVRLDELVGEYVDRGWRLGLVSDHGMNTKANGEPRVRYLGDVLDRARVRSAHVVLPITDPYVVHHASLGSACWIYAEGDELERAEEVVADQPGVEQVLSREQAASDLELPADRIGDLVVLADAGTALGRRRAEHDLGALAGALRSHGGRHEAAVPIVLSERVDLPDDVRNRDVHHLLLAP
jgi:phosphonoacetate hydrolase